MDYELHPKTLLQYLDTALTVMAIAHIKQEYRIT
jgi:hypothetical protein